MAGLQGAGKTTSVAKLAKFLTEREKKKVDTLEKEIEYTDQGQEAVVSQKITRAAAGLMSSENNGITFKVYN